MLVFSSHRPTLCEMCLAFSAYRTKSCFLHSLFFFEDHVKWRRFNCTFLMCALTHTNVCISCCTAATNRWFLSRAILFICFYHTYTSVFVQKFRCIACVYKQLDSCHFEIAHRNVPLNNWCLRGVCEYERQNVSFEGEKATEEDISFCSFWSIFGNFIDLY